MKNNIKNKFRDIIPSIKNKIFTHKNNPYKYLFLIIFLNIANVVFLYDKIKNDKKTIEKYKYDYILIISVIFSLLLCVKIFSMTIEICFLLILCQMLIFGLKTNNYIKITNVLIVLCCIFHIYSAMNDYERVFSAKQTKDINNLVFDEDQIYYSL